MKTLYVCDKCGAQFEEYDKAHECECSHLEIDAYHNFIPELVSRSVWKPEGVMPSKVVLVSTPVYEYDDEGNESKRYVFAEYTLNRLLSDHDRDKIIAAREERERKEAEELEAWHKAREAEKGTE